MTVDRKLTSQAIGVGLRLAALLAASILPLHPLDEAWARLARDNAATHDPVAFAADRAEIVRLDCEGMAR